MEDEEYRKLFEIEGRHWFYSGKREIARLLISRFFPGKEVRHLDAGCGSGILVQELGGRTDPSVSMPPRRRCFTRNTSAARSAP